MIDIFEMLNKKFDLYKEVDELNGMIYEEAKCFSTLHIGNISFGIIFDDTLIRTWKVAMGKLSLEDILNEVGLADISEQYFTKEVKNKEEAILFLQLNYNLIQYSYENVEKFGSYSFYNNLINGFKFKISYILDKASLIAIKHPSEDYFIIVPSNEKLNVVGDKVCENTTFLLAEYTSELLKGNIDRKLEILKLVANDVETYIKNNKDKIGGQIAKDLGNILNKFGIRHENKEFKQKLDKYTKQEKEELYDTTYELILDVLMLDNYNSKIRDIVVKHATKIGIEDKVRK